MLSFTFLIIILITLLLLKHSTWGIIEYLTLNQNKKKVNICKEKYTSINHNDVFVLSFRIPKSILMSNS